MIPVSPIPAPTDWNQVAVLIESLRSDFRVVAEGVADLGVRLTRVEHRLTALELRVTTLEDVTRSLGTRVGSLDARVGSLEDSVRAHLILHN